MFPEHFTSIHFFQKKKNILLYKAAANDKHYLLKCTASSDPSLRQAFQDEYSVMSGLSHPSIPVYYGISDHFSLPDQKGSFLALCMEDCLMGQDNFSSSRLLSSILFISQLSFPEFLSVLTQTAEVLSWLLDHGVLYTDLNPSNLIIHQNRNSLSISLVDYTCCYYFLENPHPEYSLRFTYDLSPSLKGQQLLIQELAYLLQDYIQGQDTDSVPSGIYRLMEAGMNPAEYLSLGDYSCMIRQTNYSRLS